MQNVNFTFPGLEALPFSKMVARKQIFKRLNQSWIGEIYLFIIAFVIVGGFNPAKAQNDTILIDFGSVASPPKWNYVSGYQAGTLQRLNNSKEEQTTISLLVTSNFVNLNASGTDNPDPITGFPASVTADNFYSSKYAMGAFEFSGLNPAREYTFIVFASRMGTDTDNREGEYKFIGLTENAVYLDASNNTSNTVSTTLKPAAEGTIKLKTGFGPNNTNGSNNYHLNAMKVVYPTPPPGEVGNEEPAVPSSDPANPNSNEDVKQILKYFHSLKNRTDHKLISGQFMGYSQGVGGYPKIEKIYTNTGKYVGLVGSDYSTQPNDYSYLEYKYTNAGLIKAWKGGSLVTLTLHLPNPTGGALKTPINLNKVLDPTNDPTTYARWFQELDLIAEGLSQLQDSGVVVLFRPLHEMNGGWFWWGGPDTNKFKILWKQVFDYFTNTKKLNNLIWVFAPNSQNPSNTTTPAPSKFYPGDEYVDLTGLDAYTSNITNGGIVGAPAMIALGKPFGITEYGPISSSNPKTPEYDYRLFVNSLKSNFPDVCFFMCWNANWGLDVNPYVKEALSDPYVANRDNLIWRQAMGNSVEINSLNKDIRIYPNPLEGGQSLKLQLDGFAYKDEIKVRIFDLMGKEIIQQKYTVSYDNIYHIKEVSCLKSGIYLLKAESFTKSAMVRLVVK